MVLLDTCALLWWTNAPDQLSAKAERACRSMKEEGGAISSISLWEIGIKVKRKKLELGLSIEDYADRIRRLGFLLLIPVDERIWIENVNLDWDHRDPVDRTIVATARLRNLSIVTKDEILRKFYARTIW